MPGSEAPRRMKLQADPGSRDGWNVLVLAFIIHFIAMTTIVIVIIIISTSTLISFILGQ